MRLHLPAALAVVAGMAVLACGRAVPGAVAEQRPLVQRVVASGRVMSPAHVVVGSLAVARVVKVPVREGARVRAGEVLVRLDDAEARAAVAQAAARLADAAARLEQVRGPSARTAAEALRQAEVELAVAGREVARLRALSEAGSASASQLDDAERTLAAARSRQEAAAAQAAGVQVDGAEARRAAAALAEAQAARTAAEARLADRTLLAPADGVVVARDVEPGDVVQPGKTLVALSLDGPVRLSADPDEKNLALLAVGQRARAVADAFPDRPFDAEVDYVSPSVDAARGTVEIRLGVAAPPPFLRPDMTVSVNVEVARRAQALAVPAEAVREAQGGAPWVLVAEGGRAVRRPVRLGLTGQGAVEVLEGLAPGAVVITAAGVEAGARVRVRPRPREAPDAL
jgi:HlyD family secretion protein